MPAFDFMFLINYIVSCIYFFYLHTVIAFTYKAGQYYQISSAVLFIVHDTHDIKWLSSSMEEACCLLSLFCNERFSNYEMQEFHGRISKSSKKLINESMNYQCFDLKRQTIQMPTFVISVMNKRTNVKLEEKIKLTFYLLTITHKCCRIRLSEKCKV